nr:GntR family transcriptional regulator [Alteromonas stellipolaris]
MKNKILSVRDQIADVLRSDIISGELASNTKLNEIQLAERFEVSRGPIRDVILKLTKEGLLISKSNVGASVNSPFLLNYKSSVSTSERELKNSRQKRSLEVQA